MATQGSLSSEDDAFSTTNSTDVYYSNEDVELLHYIVKEAQERLPRLPEQERFPTHALMDARDAAFQERGWDTYGDHKFARVLFKIGGAPDNLTMLQSFQNVMAKMGIDVEFSQNGGATRTDLTGDDSRWKGRGKHGSLVEESEVEEDEEEVEEHGSEAMDTSVSSPLLLNGIIHADTERPDDSRIANGAYLNGEGESIDAQTFSDVDYPRAADSTQAITGTYDLSVAPSEATIAGMREVLAVRHYRRYRLLRIVEHWKRIAMEQREDNVGLATIAEHRDRQTLLQNVVGGWRAKLEMKRQVGSVIDADAALARRHIVRTKFFYAWKQLTVANKLANQKAEEEARKVYQHKRSVVLGSKYFQHWRNMIRARKEREEAAEAFFTSRLKRKIFGIKQSVQPSRIQPNLGMNRNETARKMREKPDYSQHAVQQQSTVMHAGVSTTVQEHLYTPVASKQPETFMDVVDLPNAASKPGIEVWRRRAQQDHQAKLVDQAKILREAWTVWQDSMRANIVVDSIMSRVLSICLYRLILATRMVSFVRRIGERIKRSIFAGWLEKTRVLIASTNSQMVTARTHFDDKMKESCFVRLVSKMAMREMEEHSATKVRESKLLRNTMSVWDAGAQNVMELEKWSKEAHFFFVTTKWLKKWKNAAEESRREKRKLAYAQLRRSQKVLLARSSLRTWREKTRKVTAIKGQVQEVIHNKSVVSAMDMLDRWRGDTEELIEMEASAVKVQQRKARNAWVDRLKVVRDLESEADGVYLEKRGKQALRLWGLEVLKVRAKSNYADDILDKNSRKIFRGTFTTWRSKATRQEPQNPPLTVARTSRYAQSTYFAPDILLAEQTEVEVFDMPEIDFETPSKPPRLPSTTPAAPLSTAAESRLRAQFAGSSRSVRRSVRMGGVGSMLREGL